MKAVFFAVALASTLLALPACAQQGPAGVPGFPGIAASITPVLPPAPVPPAVQAKQRKRAEAECVGEKNVEQCIARMENRSKAKESCNQKKPDERRVCIEEQRQKVDCSKAADPQRCTLKKQAFFDCRGKDGVALRQCVDAKIAAVDCARTPEPARCERFQKARSLCQDKAAREHQQCLRDTLVPKR